MTTEDIRYTNHKLQETRLSQSDRAPRISVQWIFSQRHGALNPRAASI